MLIKNFLFLAIYLACIVFFQNEIYSQDFDWSNLPPTKPAVIWRLEKVEQAGSEPSYKLVRITTPSSAPVFNEMKRVGVYLDHIVINNPKEIKYFNNRAEVAIISRLTEGIGGVGQPRLVDLTTIKKGESRKIDLPLIGPRFWTGVDNYDLRFDLLEIDDNKTLTQLGTSADFEKQYGQVKDTFRELTNSLTSAAVTPQEAAIVAVLQPIIMAVVNHYRKPDHLLRTRLSLTTKSSSTQDSSTLLLQNGLYVIEYQEPGSQKKLNNTTLLNSDFTLQSSLSGNGSTPNFLVLKVVVEDGDSNMEQESREKLALLRDKLQNSGGITLPSSIRSLLQTENLEGELFGQLELNDLKKRSEYRWQRATTEKAKLEALQWFINQINNGMVPFGVNNTSPIFNDNQIRGAIGYITTHFENIRPIVNTDEPGKVLEAWSGLIETGLRDFVGETPARQFVLSAGQKRFRSEKSLDVWYFNKMKNEIQASNKTADDIKTAFRKYLENLERINADERLTLQEQIGLVDQFGSLFQLSKQSLPNITGTPNAKAQAYIIWFEKPERFLEVSSSTPNLKVNADDVASNLLEDVEAILSAKTVSLTPDNDLFLKILNPLINALADQNGVFAKTETKSRIGNWLAQHTDGNFGTDSNNWLVYYANQSLIVYSLGGRKRIIRKTPLFKGFLAAKSQIDTLVKFGQDNPTNVLRGNDLRTRLSQVTSFFTIGGLQKEPETLLLENINNSLGTSFTSKSDYLKVINERADGVLTIMFSDGILRPGNTNYAIGASIISSLNNLRNLSSETDRSWELQRAIYFITGPEGSNDPENRNEVLSLLTGANGLTNFPVSSSNQFTKDAWTKWLNEFNPEWDTTLNRYISKNNSVLVAVQNSGEAQ